MRFFEFDNAVVVRIGDGAARIVSVDHDAVAYVDASGSAHKIVLRQCAGNARALRAVGQFPPGRSTTWSGLGRELQVEELGYGLVGLRGALDEPPWFQFLDDRRTQLEFEDSAQLNEQLRQPLAEAGWNSFDAS